MSKIRNNPTITDNTLVNEVRKAFEHRATWMGLIYDEARKSGKDITDILRSAIWRCGNIAGAGHFSLMENKKDVSEFHEYFLNELLENIFEMEYKETTDKVLDIEFHYCPLVAAWKKLGFDDETIDNLCDCAMDGDRGIAESCNFDFTLGKTIAKGDSVCEVTFRRKL